MTEKLKLIFDPVVELKKNDKNTALYESLRKIERLVKNEFIDSATFSLVVDAFNNKSKVFLINKKIKGSSRVNLEFTVK